MSSFTSSALGDATGFSGVKYAQASSRRASASSALDEEGEDEEGGGTRMKEPPFVLGGRSLGVA